MAHLIDKDAVLAEIERLREELQDKVETNDFIAGEVFIMNYFLSFIVSLEVKEVDLEKEICKALINLKSKDSMRDWFTHFFELGLNTSNLLTLEDIGAIDNLLWDLSVEHSKNHTSNEVYYKEVLKRFKERKEK